jgi:anaerobic sulfite reductase subunit C
MSVNTKELGKTALRLRVPGGHIETKWFKLINEIAETYGNGAAHITTRQGFELAGIDFDKIPEVNKMIRPLIQGWDWTLKSRTRDIRPREPGTSVPG